MRTRMKSLFIVVGVVLITVSVIVWAKGGQDVERVQYSTPGPTNSLSASGEPTPTPSVSTVSPSSTPAPTDQVSKVTNPAKGDIPEEVTVKRGSKVVVRTVKIGPVTSFSAKDVWSPVPGTAEWYRFDDYPRPGEASTLKSIIGGHVTYGRKLNGDPKPNVFFTLENTKQGDAVIVRYKSGQTYEFTVTKIVIEDKETIRTDQEIWGYGKESRSVVLFTCDNECGYSANGHTKCNRAVIATMK